MLPLLFLVAVTSAADCGLKPVQNLTVAKVTHTTVELTWSAPPAEDAGHVRGYRVCRTIVETYGYGYDLCSNVWDPAIIGYNYTDLTPCLDYNISISVLGDRNTSSAPVFVNITTAPDRVHFLQHSRKDDDTITVTWEYTFWKQYQSCATQFQLTYCVVRRTNCTTKRIPIHGLRYTLDFQKRRDCNSYSIEIVVLDSNQQTSEDPVLPYVAPPDIIGVPENLKVTNYSSSSIDVSWKVPISHSTCEFFTDVYFSSQAGNFGYSYSTLYDDGRCNHSQTNLKSCMKHDVTVDFGLFKENEGKTSIKAYTSPAGDKIFDRVAVQEETSSSITVAWTTSLESNQCIEAYSVCWRKLSASHEDCRNAMVEDRGFQITDLDANTTYRVSVAALLKTGTEFGKETVEAATKSGI